MLVALNSQDSCKCSIKLAISTLGSLHSLPSARQNCEPLCSLPTPPLKSLMLSLAKLRKTLQTVWLVFSTLPGIICILKRALGCAPFKRMRTLELVNSAQGSSTGVCGWASERATYPLRLYPTLSVQVVRSTAFISFSTERKKNQNHGVRFLCRPVRC